MSQPFNIVMTTAEIMRNSYHAGYRVSPNHLLDIVDDILNLLV